VKKNFTPLKNFGACNRHLYRFKVEGRGATVNISSYNVRSSC
jgi:hypothetical protein